MPSQSSTDRSPRSRSQAVLSCLFTLMLLLSACSPAGMQPIPVNTSTYAEITSSPVPIPTQPVASSTSTRAEPTKPVKTLTALPSASPEPTQANAASFPDPDGFTWQMVAEGLSQPVGVASAMDGSGRLFVLEQAGLIRIIQDGKLLSDPFIDLRERVSTQGSTVAGLLGLAFHPQFPTNGYFFIHYTEAGGDSVIARYRTTEDKKSGDPSSELRLLEISFPIGEHKGGDLQFGPDGYLYISVGDGGVSGYGDQQGNAQDPASRLGKILRIDVDGAEPYAIPEDNPFVSGAGLPEVWAYGLRNPWRFTFDRLTGEMYIPDVGENRFEEINFLPAAAPGGANFGWNYLEGSDIYKEQPPVSLKLTAPVVQYDHTQGCSVTGGVVYRGTALPEWYGIYIYGDFCQGNIWGLLKGPDGSWYNRWLYKLPGFITSFGQDEEGEVYLVDLTGKIYELVRLPDN